MGVGGRGKWVIGIEEGTCWDEHWVSDGNQFDNKLYLIYIKKKDFVTAGCDLQGRGNREDACRTSGRDMCGQWLLPFPEGTGEEEQVCRGR